MEAAREAADAGKKAVESAADEKILEAERTKAVAEVNAAMRLVVADPHLAESLPIPRYVGRTELVAALQHDSAWTSGKISADLIEPIIDTAISTGSALYYEWACQTGKERQTGEAFLKVLDARFTAYPKRLLMVHALDERKLMGYESERNCSASALELWRNRQRRALEAVKG